MVDDSPMFTGLGRKPALERFSHAFNQLQLHARTLQPKMDVLVFWLKDVVALVLINDTSYYPGTKAKETIPNRGIEPRPCRN
jgi:hypothetical protein